MAVLPEGRVRIGITGLAVVFLLVLLGAMLTRTGEEVALDAQEERLAEEAPPTAEPLSELGAAPGQPAEEPVEIDPIEIPIDPATEELIVNEIAGPDAG